MLIGWMLLPAPEKYPLPPRLIAEQIMERVGLDDRLNEGEMIRLTLFSHFGYGALFGAIYAIFENRIPVQSSLRGALAGIVLWIGSYLGWLPAIGILRPATRHPWRRNLLMIVAHVIWGVTLGELKRKLSENK